MKASKKGDLMTILMEGVLAQIDEVSGDIADDPKRMLAPPRYKKATGLRGNFTQTVQSIFSGGIDAKEARRMLGAELAPFVDGPCLAIALEQAARESKTADELQVELCDAFVIRAIDELARGLVAMALGRPKDVPETCRPHSALLTKHAAAAKDLIA